MKAIIIGAGIGGLATANLLAKAGYQVEVYEAASQPGGRTGQLVKDGFTFDTGPSWLLMKDVFEQYYQLLDKQLDSELDLIRLDPAYKVFFENNPPVTIHSDLTRDAATFDTIEPGSGLKLQSYLKASQRTYQQAIRHFLYSNFDRPANLLQPTILKSLPTLIRLLARPLHSVVAKQFKTQRLQQILEYQMVFLGISPFSAPSMYSLMSTLDFEQGVFYPRGGLYRLIESLETIGKGLGVNYHYGTAVTKILAENKRVTAIELADGRVITADIVISNADLQYTEQQLLPASARSYPDKYFDGQLASPSALLMYLGVKGELPELEHHSLLFVKSWKQNFDAMAGGTMPDEASIYICRASATDSTSAPAGHENIFVLVPIPAGVKLSTEQQETYADHYLEQIKQMTGTDLKARTVSRTVYGPDYFSSQFHTAGGSMLGPAHSLFQSALFRSSVRSRKLTNLYYVGGSARPGIGLPMCLISAQLVYKALSGDHSDGPLTEIRHV